MKPKLYLETSIISYLTARLSSDYLVSTRQRENAVGHAPALRERDAGASRRHSHAGAWKREKSYGIGVQSFSFGNAVSP